jgi:hypothetical protein
MALLTHRPAILGHSRDEWSDHIDWSVDKLDEEGKNYYKGLIKDVCTLLCVSKGISLRQLKSTYEQHSGKVDLSKLKMKSWVTLVISLRYYIKFKQDQDSNEMFAYPSKSASSEIDSDAQSRNNQTPLQKNEPNPVRMRDIDIQVVFIDGFMDSVTGQSQPDPRVPNQSAQLATPEEIAAGFPAVGNTKNKGASAVERSRKNHNREYNFQMSLFQNEVKKNLH